ncbi:MAG: methyltransferase, partial [Proteobacteria bacterium]|nr:methyltransferase [Pseudomonadota bacterium]
MAWLEPDRESAAVQQDLARWRHDRISQWRTLYESSYGQRNADDLAFDLTGWTSSYTGQPIPAHEMREWVDATVARICQIMPTPSGPAAEHDQASPKPRVLEIGCGTGLLLARLAPDCATYLGLDFSSESVTAARSLRASRIDLAHVQIEERTADDTAHLPAGGFDLVILNSMVQYFPGVEYLERVVQGALRLLAPGGRIFLGDLRHLELLPAFQASIALHKSLESGRLTPTPELRARTERGVRNEEELLLSPALFTEWKNLWPQVTRVEVTPKRGHAPNELTKYRYDAVLFTDDDDARDTASPAWHDATSMNLDDIAAKLREDSEDVIAFTRIDNARTRDDRFTQMALSEHASQSTDTALKTATDLHAALRSQLDIESTRTLDPEALHALALAHGFTLSLSLAAASPDGALDAVFTRGDAARKAIEWPAPSRLARPLANDPLAPVIATRLASELKRWITERLPDYMIPTAWMVLERLPLNASGKIDRRALPAPTRSAERITEPRTPVEEMIAAIFADVLSLDTAGTRSRPPRWCRASRAPSARRCRCRPSSPAPP